MAKRQQRSNAGERREFIRVAVLAGIGGLAAAAGLLNLASITTRPAGASFVPLLPVAELSRFEQDKPVALEVTISRRDGWRVRNRSRRVYLLRKAPGTGADAFTALSSVCPHAGCVVELRQEAEFVCPCHNGKFDKEGAVTDGPPPRSMDALELSVRAHEGSDWLFVQWQDFVVGAEERIARGEA